MGTRRQDELFRDFGRWGFDVKDWTRGTRRVYLWRVRQANTFLEERGTSVFWASLDDLKGFLFSLDGARSRNNTRQALVGFGDFLVSSGIRDTNPAKDLPRLRQPKTLPKPLTVEEAKRMLRAAKAMGPESHTIMMLLLYSGLRRHNVAAMEWRNISSDWKWITVVVKGRRTLQVPIHPILRDKLRAWREMSKDAQWVFPSAKYAGRHMADSTLYKRVRAIAELACLEGMHPHRARHTAATRMLELTGNIMTVKEFLGHESLASTQVYSLVRNPVTEQAVYQFDFGR